jgi:hypothetical protein
MIFRANERPSIQILAERANDQRKRVTGREALTVPVGLKTDQALHRPLPKTIVRTMRGATTLCATLCDFSDYLGFWTKYRYSISSTLCRIATHGLYKLFETLPFLHSSSRSEHSIITTLQTLSSLFIQTFQPIIKNGRNRSTQRR